MRTSTFALLAGMGLMLGACGTIKDAVKGPKLTDMDSHALAASMQASPAVIASSAKPATPPAASTANSLWRPGAAPRARPGKGRPRPGGPSGSDGRLRSWGHDFIWLVVDSIWSAAETTLEFIS